MINKTDIKEIYKTYIKKEYALAIIVFSIALIGVLNALRFGIANIEYYVAKNTMQEWQEAQEVTSNDSFEKASLAVATAKILHSSNPLYIDLAGELNEWASLAGEDISNKTLQQSLESAKAYYLEATKNRPLWPVSWANLAMIKWRMQEFDDEMMTYLQKADTLGSQSHEVDLLFTRLGIALYQSNNPFYTNLRDTVHNRLRASLVDERSRVMVLAYIESTKSIEVACAWMKQLDERVAEEYLPCPLSRISAS